MMQRRGKKVRYAKPQEQEASFFDAMTREPDNADHAKVYADWLEEQGKEPEWTNFLRNSKGLERVDGIHSSPGGSFWRIRPPQNLSAYTPEQWEKIYDLWWSFQDRLNAFYKAKPTKPQQHARRGPRKRLTRIRK